MKCTRSQIFGHNQLYPIHFAHFAVSSQSRQLKQQSIDTVQYARENITANNGTIAVSKIVYCYIDTAQISQYVIWMMCIDSLKNYQTFLQSCQESIIRSPSTFQTCYFVSKYLKLMRFSMYLEKKYLFTLLILKILHNSLRAMMIYFFFFIFFIKQFNYSEQDHLKHYLYLYHGPFLLIHI